MKRFVLILLLLSFTLGHFTAPQFQSTKYIYAGMKIEVHAEDFMGLVTQSAEMWEVEIARRFPDAFVWICHGDEDENGVWVTHPNDLPSEPVQVLADRLRQQWPDRVIVLVMCNPGGDVINTPGVYYAMSSVWFFPDRSGLGLPERAIESPLTVGSIFEFVTGIPE